MVHYEQIWKSKGGKTRVILLRKNATNLSNNIYDAFLTRFLFLLNLLSPDFLGSACTDPFFSVSFRSLYSDVFCPIKVIKHNVMTSLLIYFLHALLQMDACSSFS